MNQTKIEWTELTVNPIVGCQKVSEGCANCYAAAMAKRLKANGIPAYQDVVDANGWTGNVGCQWEQLKPIPGKGKMVFVCSMSDLFYEGVPLNAQCRVMDWIEKHPQHIFQLLTKRPVRARSVFCCPEYGVPENAWLGVTCENQNWANERIPPLLEIPSDVRYVSLEPLLERVSVQPKAGVGAWKNGWLDWVIVGAETGPGRRYCDTAWVKDIVGQCHTTGVPVLVKKLHDPPKPGKLPVVISDIDAMSNRLGMPVEQWRQWPERKTK